MKISLLILCLVLNSSVLLMSGLTEHEIRENVNTALHTASEENNTHEIVRLIKMDGADINTKDAQGRTALMLAVLKGNTRSVEALLDYDPDVDKQDSDGNTALMLAVNPKKEQRVNTHHHKIMQALLEHGANPTIKNKENKDALELLEQKKMNDEVTQQARTTLQRYLDKNLD